MPTNQYGTCPFCGADIVSRERRPDGNDTCSNGHVFPSNKAIVYQDAKATPPPPEGFDSWIRACWYDQQPTGVDLQYAKAELAALQKDHEAMEAQHEWCKTLNMDNSRDRALLAITFIVNGMGPTDAILEAAKAGKEQQQ
jgi:hypothetical protein